MPFGSGLNTYGVTTLLYQTYNPSVHYHQAHNDYLAALNSRKRKAVKKERREAQENGIAIEVLTGAAGSTAEVGADGADAVWAGDTELSVAVSTTTMVCPTSVALGV